MARCFCDAAQCQAGTDADMAGAEDTLVFEHDAAHPAFGIEADPELCNVVAVFIAVAGEILFKNFCSSSAFDIGNKAFFYFADYRFVNQADAKIRNGRIANDNAFSSSFNRRCVGFNSRNSRELAFFYDAI